MTAYTYDWQREPEGTWLKWMLPMITADEDFVPEVRDQLEVATKQWTEVTLTMQVNGVDVPVGHFLEGLEKNFEYQATNTAEDMIRQATLPDFVALEAQMRAAMRRVAIERFAAAGIDLTLNAEDDY